jgi:hypothetical protein
MNQGTLITTRPTKTQYSEVEAAEELGLTVDQLRKLIRSHIAQTDEDLNHIAVASFHPSDLLVLKLLSGLNGPPIHQGSEA